MTVIRDFATSRDELQLFVRQSERDAIPHEIRLDSTVLY